MTCCKSTSTGVGIPTSAPSSNDPDIYIEQPSGQIWVWNGTGWVKPPVGAVSYNATTRVLSVGSSNAVLPIASSTEYGMVKTAGASSTSPIVVDPTTGELTINCTRLVSHCGLVTDKDLVAGLAGLPSASTTVAGKTRYATTAEAIAGTSNTVAMTPASTAAQVNDLTQGNACRLVHNTGVNAIPKPADVVTVAVGSGAKVLPIANVSTRESVGDAPITFNGSNGLVINKTGLYMIDFDLQFQFAGTAAARINIQANILVNNIYTADYGRGVFSLFVPANPFISDTHFHGAVALTKGDVLQFTGNYLTGSDASIEMQMLDGFVSYMSHV